MRDIYPIELIKTGIKFLQEAKFSKYGPELSMRSMIVYELVPMEGGFLPLGRDYKPLGLCGYGEWVTYEEYPFLVIPKERVDLSHLIEINQKGDVSYFLFNDGTYPDSKKSKDLYISLIKKIFSI